MRNPLQSGANRNKNSNLRVTRMQSSMADFKENIQMKKVTVGSGYNMYRNKRTLEHQGMSSFEPTNMVMLQPKQH